MSIDGLQRIADRVPANPQFAKAGINIYSATFQLEDEGQFFMES
jgi:hypothetical protein